MLKGRGERRTHELAPAVRAGSPAKSAPPQAKAFAQYAGKVGLRWRARCSAHGSTTAEVRSDAVGTSRRLRPA